MIYEICYNTGMITYLQPTEDTMAQYNLLLNNCINKVHPALIYISWIALVTFFLFVLPQQHNSHRTSVVTNKVVLLMFTTLAMGG